LNQVGSLNKISKAFSKFEQENERRPSPEELADELEIPVDKISDTLKVSGRHISVDAPFVEGEDNSLLGDGWDEDISPLGAMVRDGKMYGRGACDMKSGLACALTAFKNMVKKVGERGELPEKPFSMICSVDEEDFMRGVEAAIKAGWVTKDDWILDTEPTDGQIQSMFRNMQMRSGKKRGQKDWQKAMQKAYRKVVQKAYRKVVQKAYRKVVQKAYRKAVQKLLPD
jgi:DNA-directed RNA polymerase sigma subunit (sigma70/sigma32)